MLRAAISGAVFALVTIGFGAPVMAKIQCDGRYQVTRSGDTIATPYCEDWYLAVVARRTYGVSTSPRAVRKSIHEKERVCRMIGHDARVDDICLDFKRDQREGAWD